MAIVKNRAITEVIPSIWVAATLDYMSWERKLYTQFVAILNSMIE